MVKTTPTSQGAGTKNSLLPLYLTGVFIAVIAAAYLSLWLGHVFSGTSGQVPGNPFTALIEVAGGDLAWPTMSTVLVVVLLVVGAGLAGVLAAALGKKSTTAIDDKARLMGSTSKLTGVTGTQAAARARSLRGDLDADHQLTDADIGVLVGRTVQGGKKLFASWEDMILALAGPRMGKTAALAIDNLCTAPGPALFTSNKRDGHDATRGIREGTGAVWRYDLQAIADGPHVAGDGFYWNPLRSVVSIVAARKLASYFAAASRDDAARVDAYFDGGAQELLAQMMLAASCGGGDLLHVYGWLSDEENELPQHILETHGHHIVALRLKSVRELNPRQRDGLYDMARRFVGLLEERTYAMSILPPERADLSLAEIPDTTIGRTVRYPHSLPEFVVDDFVTSTDTLYALSKEGPDSSAALTTALIGSIIDAAQRTARLSPRGRLPVPMLCILDEAANVCRLPELPAWYSHLGSQGICVMTIVQNLSRAQRVWGADGVKQLVDAANFLWYGGGLKDKNALADFSSIVGDHDVERWSTSNSGGLFGGGSSSRSQSWSKEAILTVDDLSSLPKQRALVFISGNKPVLVAKLDWYRDSGPNKTGIEDSLALYSIGDKTRNLAAAADLDDSDSYDDAEATA
ncbi:TraM recognition domain-containing protein [Rhodococcus sp. BP-252]|uniref:type IV secretory system conjugative DNA transfer family protein n=1 Tax=unclassified Rhodococcus (in: high G+C Gram-positive bacteria) TaxID=192944 RepID=UPI001C9B5E95|nr:MULTISPECIES: type IV secretory system conjugative DNA transfer family protein [unclassified Rhodococcus (in: high G+C Gram-positive bacteria)]MBY6413340.1 TraM recognition domain-containing protein [Rhodococcus sp. BP-320]MBY6418056.1 TraM recognition domain-containing protein [Rhodococcus sp. BP-321]MBY6422254.1 TraM recognition domain-containing protein [Rhodococcus sp. BP-324]MBY6428105.1 TraM recognition domain-containing protein [Rhodococcus sp. BP-323]MBY6433261.1 TraM recognition do